MSPSSPKTQTPIDNLNFIKSYHADLLLIFSTKNFNSRLIQQIISRLVKQILQSKPVQMCKESLNRSAQNTGKTAGWRNQTFIVFSHAFDNLHGFKMAHDRADIDFIGCVGKT